MCYWPPKLDFKLQSPKHNLVTTPKYNYAERSHDYRWTKPYKTFAKPFWITVCSSYVYSLLCSAITHYTIPWITWVYKWYMHRAWPWHRYAEAGARSRCQLCSLSSSSSSLSSSSLSLSIVAMTQVCWARVSNQGVNQGQGAKQGARSRCQLCCLSSSSSTSYSLSSSSSSYSSSSSSSDAEARCSIRVSIMLLIGNLLWLPSAALRLQWSLTRHAKMCKSFAFSKFIACSFLSSDTILASYWSSTEQMWIPIGSSNAIEKVRTRSNFVIKKWEQDFFKVESKNLNFVSLVLLS